MPSENIYLVHGPETSSGKQRPCGTLLQLVVVILGRMHSISGSVESMIPVIVEQNCNTTHFYLELLTIYGTAAGGQFGWGATLLKRYQ
jgi:hypothetical protein